MEAFNLGRSLSLGRKKSSELKAFDQIEIFKQSIRESSVFFGNNLILKFESSLASLKMLLPKIEPNFLGQYIHDLIIFDRGAKIDSFLEDVFRITKLYKGDDQLLAVRTLAKTYFIKDEVFIAHVMVSPMRRLHDDLAYKNLGQSFNKTFINRPSFDLGNKKIEFDFSPKPWMLIMMRHARFLRPLLRSWHRKEREISQEIKKKILGNTLLYAELKLLENIKGYREVRYNQADSHFPL